MTGPTEQALHDAARSPEGAELQRVVDATNAASVVYDVAAIGTIVHALQATIPQERWHETATPIVAAPGSWLREVARQLGAPEGDIPASIHQCDVFQEDHLTEPYLVTSDEPPRVYRVRSAVPALGQAGQTAEVVGIEDLGMARRLRLLQAATA